VPVPTDFVRKVDAVFHREVRKGAVPQFRGLQATTDARGSNAPTATGVYQELRYSWIPVSEIHTAQTRIDTFMHLSAAERQNLHEEFAAAIAGLISQFDLIGQIDDGNITPEQSALLTSAFSDSILEIENFLFRPITRRLVIERRGPLFRPEKDFEARHLRYRHKQTLSDVVTNIRRRTLQPQKKGRQVVVSTRLGDSQPSVLPPQYETQQPLPFTPLDRRSFSEMTAIVRAEMEAVELKNREERKARSPAPPRRRPEVIFTPRATVPVQLPPPKVQRKPVGRPMFDEVEKAENAFLAAGDFELEPITGIETGDCLEGIERLFAPAPPPPPPPPPPFEALALLPPKRHKANVGCSDYILEVTPEQIQVVVDDGAFLVVVDEERVKFEYAELTDLWDNLGLPATTRLSMAARLCSCAHEEVESDYTFTAVMKATRAYKDYDECFRLYKQTLRLDPLVGAEDKRTLVSDLATKFKVAENVFRGAMDDLTHLIGYDLVTGKGTVPTMLQDRAVKIQNLRLICKLDALPRTTGETN
jgi:hypothetical protein